MRYRLGGDDPQEKITSYHIDKLEIEKFSNELSSGPDLL